MNKGVIYDFLDNNGNDLRKKIKTSKNLQEFLSYGIPKSTIAIVWAILNDEKDYKKIKYFYDFHSDESLQRQKKEYIKFYNTTEEKQKIINEENLEMYKKFKKTKYETSEFKIRENTIGGYIESYKTTPNEFFPIFKEDGVIKIYKDFKNIETIEKFNMVNVPEYVFFEDKDGNTASINKYTHIIEYEIPVEKLEYSKKNLAESVGVIQNIRLINVNAEYSIKDVQIDRRIFAMMLIRKKFYNDRIFLNEDEKVLSEKKRFSLKYYKNTLSYGSQASITLTNFEGNLVVKLAKVKNDKDMQDIKILVNGLLNDYITTKPQIIQQYQKYHKITFTDTDIVKKKSGAKATKTKIRLGPLIEKNPELFSNSSYSILCPMAHQPIPLTEKQAKKMEPTKVLEYPKDSGDFYGCNPKPGDVKQWIFPGLKENTVDKKAGKEVKFDYVPCCYPINQYDKKSKGLYKYMHGITTEKEGGILDKQKKLAQGRKGQIPTFLASVLEFHGMKPDDYLRYGLPPSKQSVYYAVATIKYPEMDVHEAKDKVVKELAKSKSIYAAYQSYTPEYIRQTFIDEELSVKAENIASMLEYFLDALVIVIDHRDFVQPDNKFGYFPSLFPRKNVVILYKKDEQIELVGSYDGNFIFDDPKPFMESRKKVWKFYSNISYKYPIFSSLVKNATHQYVDVFGKCRGLVIDNQTIFLPPIAPINKPLAKKIHKGNIQEIIEKFNIELIYKDSQCVYSKFLQFPYDEFEQDLPKPKKKYVKPFIFSEDKFFNSSYNNEVEAIRLMTTREKGGKKLKEWKKLNISAPRISAVIENIPSVIILGNSGEVYRFIQLLKSNNDFKWENLENIKFNKDSLHYLFLDGKPFSVHDVTDYPDDLETDYGIYDIAYGKKIEDGPGIIIYGKDKFGVLTKL